MQEQGCRFGFRCGGHDEVTGSLTKEKKKGKKCECFFLHL